MSTGKVTLVKLTSISETREGEVFALNAGSRVHATRVTRTRISDPRCTLSGNSIGGLDLGASLDCTVRRPTQWRNDQMGLEPPFGQVFSRKEETKNLISSILYL